MRQIGKQILTIVLLLGLSAPASANALVTTIVTDPLTGVALDGFDPVTYFTDAQPQLGSPDFEYYYGGVPWYFVSAANRDVFMRAPDIYAPQFGGYCEMSLARGYLSDGKPSIYVVENMRLYLFYSAANREAFRLAHDQAIADASTNWTVLRKDLIGPEPVIPVFTEIVAEGEPVVDDHAAEVEAPHPVTDFLNDASAVSHTPAASH